MAVRNQELYKGTLNNSSLRKGGTRISTNETRDREAAIRVAGNNEGIRGKVVKGNLPRVAAAGGNNVPEDVRITANKMGGRNALPPAGPNGTMTAHDYRYRELRSAFGMSAG